jgi:hypothetical protein
MAFSKIEGSGTVRTGLDTSPTPDASIVVDGHNTILSLIGRIYGTNRNARGIVALQAGARKKMPCYLRIGPHFLLENRTIHYARREIIFRHASHSTGMTPNTFFQIDDHNPVSIFWSNMHGLLQFGLHSKEDAVAGFRKVWKLFFIYFLNYICPPAPGKQVPG